MAEQIYTQVGARLRELRLERGVSQSELGRDLGVSYQQIQKYEIGTNRMPLSKLVNAAHVLGVTIAAILRDADTPFDEGRAQDKDEYALLVNWRKMTSDVAKDALFKEIEGAAK